MHLPRAVAGNIVADLENFRKVTSGPFRGIVLGLLDARGRGRQDERLREGIGLDDGGRVGVGAGANPDQAEAVVGAHGGHRQADAAAERAAKGGANSLRSLRPDAAGEGHGLDFAVQLVFQADAAGAQTNWKGGWILDSQFDRSVLLFAEVDRHICCQF